MPSPLVQINGIEAQVNPEKIFAIIFLIPQIFVALVIILTALYFQAYILLLLALIIALYGLYKYLLILSSAYYITDQQMVIERGVFTKTVNYLELYRVKDILVRQPFWMKTIGLMNVTLLSFDSSEPLLILKGIKISKLPQMLRNHVQECRLRNKVLTVDN